VRNFATILLLSAGTPMILAGDEFGRTQLGNNNAYCQDNETSWVDWRLLDTNADLFRFFKLLIGLRRTHPLLRREVFDLDEERHALHLAWHGVDIGKPDWSWESRALAMHLYDSSGGEAEDIYVIANAHWEAHAVELPHLSEPSLVSCRRHHADAAARHRRARRRRRAGGSAALHGRPTFHRGAGGSEVHTLMIIPNLLALDVDGVLCDGMQESCEASRRSDMRDWPDETVPGEDLFPVFRTLRPVIMTGWEMPLRLRAIVQGRPPSAILQHWGAVCEDLVNAGRLHGDALVHIPSDFVVMSWPIRECLDISMCCFHCVSSPSGT
jgi:hypothetical protein